MTNILLTGGCGYIGSMLVDRLLAEKDNTITVIDNLRYGGESLLHQIDNVKFKLVKGDILDHVLLEKMFEKGGYDCVVNLAALVGDPLCKEYSTLARNSNTLGVAVLLRISAKHKVPLFIQSSTCSNYGITTELATETSALNPISIYATSKVEAERLVEGYPHSYIIFRNSTVYGISHRTRLDNLPNVWVKEAYQGKDIEVYEPEGMRPFIHIRDVVEYFARAVRTAGNTEQRGIYNTGSINVTKKALALTVQEFFPSIQIKIVQSGDKRSYSVDFSKSQRTFNYIPTVNLYNGIRNLKEAMSLFSNLDDPLYDNVKGFRQ